MKERVVVLDFGGQYNQLIARRVREAGVYSELLPRSTSMERIKGDVLNGIILTGGPDSVYADDAKTCPEWVFDLGVPVLGICYGMQYIAHINGGVIKAANIAEYGRTPTKYEQHPLFEGMDERIVWMNHNDYVEKLPDGFCSIASTANCPVAAMANEEKRLYGIQFHAEVVHTIDGSRIFKNFLKNICGCTCDWSPKNIAGSMIADIKNTVGDSKVIAGLSGGVDSSVASTLVHMAIGSNLTCIFVDHGLLRKNEAEEVMKFYEEALGLNIIKVDASERFLSKLAGVTDPETKRKIIGEEFVRIFEEEASKIEDAKFLLQGTIYPDVIESGSGGSAVIKSHHNVGGLPSKMNLTVLEPLRMLFKDEVRELGESLGIPAHLVWRQPFPGPGLAIRIMGDVTREKLEILRESDYVMRRVIAEAGLEHELWQYFTVFTGVRSVGVMGDLRTYDYAIGVRAITSTDAMSADWAEIPFPVLRRISDCIIAEVKHVNRVVYDITSKPPGTVEWE